VNTQGTEAFRRHLHQVTNELIHGTGVGIPQGIIINTAPKAVFACYSYSDSPLDKHLRGMAVDNLRKVAVEHTEARNEFLRRRLNYLCGLKLDETDRGIYVALRYPLPTTVQLIEAGKKSVLLFE
jgi:hypothetical protein